MVGEDGKSAVPNNIPSLATVKLTERLSNGTPGDVLTDEQLKETCGKDCRPNGQGYGSLATAIRRALTDKTLVWKRLAGQDAIKCLTAEEIDALSDSSRKHIHRISRRSRRQIMAAAVNGDEELQKHLGVKLAIMGSVEACSSSRLQKKLAVRDETQPLDANRLLEAFRSA
jgi:hypothetical protein